MPVQGVAGPVRAAFQDVSGLVDVINYALDNGELSFMVAKVNPIAHFVNTLQSEGDILVFLGAGSSTEGSQDDAPYRTMRPFLISKPLLRASFETKGSMLPTTA